jgi:multiple sugar transport system permease protein
MMEIADNQSAKAEITELNEGIVTGSRYKRILLRWLGFALALFGALVILLPLLWMFSTALKPNSEIFVNPPKIFPSTWKWSNFSEVWKRVPFGRYYVNSIIVAVSVVIGQVLTSAMAAYAFARLKFRGRDKLFLCYLATLMVPGAVTMIPLFIILRFMGFLWRVDIYLFDSIYMGSPFGLNSFFALIVPGFFTAYGTFLLRQFFMGIPTDLEEAVKIDGGGHWTIFTKIVIPLSVPALITLGIFTLLGIWREFMWPLVIVNTESLKTLPIGLASFQGMYRTDWSLLMAAAIMVMAPLVVIFFFAQRFFVEGIKLQGIKG